MPIFAELVTRRYVLRHTVRAHKGDVWHWVSLDYPAESIEDELCSASYKTREEAIVGALRRRLSVSEVFRSVDDGGLDG